MLAVLARKARQVAADPILRHWLVGRALGRHPAAPAFTAHRPPYLPPPRPLAATVLPTVRTGADAGAAISFRCHGRAFAVDPTAPERLFDQPGGDLETRLALHRFAWLPLVPDADAATLAALWRAWIVRYLAADDPWVWHPYTATERAIALLDFCAEHGWPGGDAQAVFARHVAAIQAGLEYFGEHHTSNHLANNGRGLAHLGLRLGDPVLAESGLRILIEEARRLFLPSGVLREGSSHYHLLYAARYAEMAALAQAHHRPEAAALYATATRALAVVPHLRLPGGLPLIGDISPDMAPEAVVLPPLPSPCDNAALAADGWLRRRGGDWDGLWHAAPGGWSHMPGHGHQDCGACELHWRGQPVFVDPGRGAYGEDGEAALYRSAILHNGLTVDGADPYPSNRPYYDDGFRRSIGGPPPRLTAHPDGVGIEFSGYGRLGASLVSRRWRLGEGLAIEDAVHGRGRHRIERRLHTPFPVRLEGGGALIDTPAGRLRVTASTPLHLQPCIRWRAYGEGENATAIVASVDAPLPWRGTLDVGAA